MTEGRPISLEELRARFEQEQTANARLRSLEGMTRKGGTQAEAAEKAKRRLLLGNERKGRIIRLTLFLYPVQYNQP